MRYSGLAGWPSGAGRWAGLLDAAANLKARGGTCRFGGWGRQRYGWGWDIVWIPIQTGVTVATRSKMDFYAMFNTKAWAKSFACYALVSIPAGANYQTPLTIADIQGTVIRIQTLYQSAGSRNGQSFTGQHQEVHTITINSSSSLTYEAVNTWLTSSGAAYRSSAPRSDSFTLDKPKAGRVGHTLWTFQGGKLISLRTFQAGASKATIAFTRSGANDLHCTYSRTFPHEIGVAGWHWTSPVSGEDMHVTSIRAVSSSCEVTRR